MALLLPAAAEADVCETDGAPSEDGRQTGEREQPVQGETSSVLATSNNVAEETHRRGNTNGGEGAALAINVGKEARCLSLLSERGQGAGRAIDGGVANRENSNENNAVHNGWEDLDSSIINGDNEWRGLGIFAAGSEESLITIWNQQTDNGQGHDVEETDTPEDLLDGSWQGLAGVVGLSGSQADQLGTGERESGSDEHAAQALESGMERSRRDSYTYVGLLFVSSITGLDCIRAPVSPTNVAALRTATTVEDYAKDDETNNGSDLDDGKDELSLTITTNAEQVDTDNDDQENGNPCCLVGIFGAGPKRQCDRGGDELKRQDDQPLHGVTGEDG